VRNHRTSRGQGAQWPHLRARLLRHSRAAWRTFRVDRINAVLAISPASDSRPLDTVSNWLTQVGEEGDEVVVVVEAWNRWLFEPLPGAQWLPLRTVDTPSSFGPPRDCSWIT